MTQFTRPPIVVGTDGSAASIAALAWAAQEAARRALPLHVVHAWSVPLPPVAMGPAIMHPSDDQLRQAAQAVLDHAVETVRVTSPDVEIVPTLSSGPPVSILLATAEDAAMVVVGRSGLDSFSEFFLGSISMQVVTHAACPVAVIGEPEEDVDPGPDTGRVVVGIDGSELSVDAAGVAFDEASTRSVGLTLLHVWNTPAYDASGVVMPSTLMLEEAQQDELRAMAETVNGLQEKYPDVRVEKRLAQGKPGKVLTDASRGAELVVVGSRGHGGFAKLMLGSTSHTLLHHSHCPVLVVRPGTV